MTSIDFRVTGMDTGVTPLLISSDSFATEPSATASINISLANIQTIFTLKSTDNTEASLQFYADRANFNTYLDLSSAIMTAFAQDTATSDDNRFADDYLRYVAKKIFNSTNGTDLFSNKSAVKTQIHNDFKSYYDGLLVLIDRNSNNTNSKTFGVEPSFNMSLDTAVSKYYLTNENTGSYNVVYTLFKQLQQKQPARASDFLGVSDVGIRAFPFQEGDSLTIYLTIKPNELQSITSNAYSRIENKTYAIKINVIANE
jgi:hypothetical protein